jgi:hypothetical protein
MLVLHRLIKRYEANSNETFIPLITLITEEKPDKLSVTYTNNVETNDIKTLIASMKNIVSRKVKEEDITYNNEQSIITDALTYHVNQENYKFLTSTKSSKTAYFIRTHELPLKNFTDNDVVIGYINDIDEQFIVMIMKSLKNITPNYVLRKISIQTNNNDNIDKSLFSKNKIDVLFVYESLESKDITKRIDQNMKLEVWDYADSVDIHKLKVQIPFVRKNNIDFSIHFPQLRGKLDIVSSVFVIDIIIIVNDNKIKRKNVDYDLNNIISFYDKPELINMYGKYFNMSTLSLQYAKERNKFFMNRSSMQILEQFVTSSSNKSFTYDVSNNVNGFYDTKNNIFYLYSNIIYGIPLKENDLFKFTSQMREEQNGLYRVNKVSSKQSILLRLDNDNIENDNLKNDIGYLCYNRPDIPSKSACDSLYDELGNFKYTRTYWDKPCEKNNDCPFYQANKNYNNYRGGCIDGRCEMPIGVKPVSYRLFDNKTKPVCYNCKKEDDNPFCCDEQKKNKKYPKLKSPDYAFELDEFERLSSHQS